ncbi:MAG: FGGY family carbohydrate kinase, partial [Acidimicrobiia bacterium]
AATPALALGTVDAWVLWTLTGATSGGCFATEPSNASRTLLFDIDRLAWSEELCALFGIPTGALPEVQPSASHFGAVVQGWGLRPGTPVAGVAGDQQAALFGQACHRPGMAKSTYGTGSFVLMDVGAERPPPTEGLLTTVAWTDHDGPTYALEGAVFSTGAAVQWLRDGLGVVVHAAETAALAASVDSSEGVVVVPAFTGLGSPWWDPHARGTIVGLTRGVGRAHLARAVLEAIAFRNRDVVDAMTRASGHAPGALRVDGGAAANDVLLQLQADQLGCRVERPVVTEATAWGAAGLAGLTVGVWDSLDEVGATWQLDRAFEPGPAAADADEAYRRWLRAVERARGWEVPGP